MVVSRVAFGCYFCCVDKGGRPRLPALLISLDACTHVTLAGASAQSPAALRFLDHVLRGWEATRKQTDSFAANAAQLQTARDSIAALRNSTAAGTMSACSAGGAANNVVAAGPPPVLAEALPPGPTESTRRTAATDAVAEAQQAASSAIDGLPRPRLGFQLGEMHTQPAHILVAAEQFIAGKPPASGIIDDSGKYDYTARPGLCNRALQH